jgi:hypothetical protein
MHDDTTLHAVRQATDALSSGAVERAPAPEDMGLLGQEARALVEQLIDLLHGVDRATPDANDPRTRDLRDLRTRLSTALRPADIAAIETS